jgi:CubicO group peptidase (beta-lactamase class C family)
VAKIARFVELLICALCSLTAFSQTAARLDINVHPIQNLLSHGDVREPTANRENNPALTAEDLDAFLGGLVSQQLQREDVAGAVVVVVKDGKVLFEHGYGYADVEKRTPVSPENTLFRPASISKLFLWTAVLQLREQGKLDLDRDVNEYLDFRIPPKFGRPITLRNIMTHRTGFQESVKDLYTSDPGSLESLGTYVKSHVPDRIYPPGDVPAYSNYAACLAGYIVERVSGQRFEEYVEDHIFKPLGMSHTTFRQPLPEGLKSLMSKGYKVASKPAIPFEPNEGPQGGLTASGADMAPFMIAQLQEGQYNGARILKPETVALMQARQLAINPALDWMCLGFYEEDANGLRILSHAGGSLVFFSDLHLIPEKGLGFFVSYNSLGKGEIRPQSTLWQGFLDRYYPVQSPPPFAGNRVQDAKSVEGYYEPSRGFQTDFLKTSTMMGQYQVTAEKDGTIRIFPAKDPNGQLTRWEEYGPLLYRDTNGISRVGFQRDATGRMTLSIIYPVFVFQRVSGLDTRPACLSILIGSGVVFLLTLLLWPVAALVRLHYRITLGLTQEQLRRRLMARIGCVFNSAFLIGFLLLVALPTYFTSRLDPWIRLIQLLGVFSFIGGVFIIYEAVRTWREKERWLWTKLVNSLIAFSAIGMAWFIFHFHFLHWGLNY